MRKLNFEVTLRTCVIGNVAGGRVLVGQSVSKRMAGQPSQDARKGDGGGRP